MDPGTVRRSGAVGDLAAMAKGQVHQKGQTAEGCKELQLTLTMSP